MVLSLHSMYEAGCTADLKTGTGDIPRALAIETFGVNFAWGGISLAALIAIVIPHITIGQRVLSALAITFIGFALFLCLGVSAENRGVLICLSESSASAIR